MIMPPGFPSEGSRFVLCDSPPWPQLFGLEAGLEGGRLCPVWHVNSRPSPWGDSMDDLQRLSADMEQAEAERRVDRGQR